MITLCSDEGLTPETLALKHFMMANLHYQLSWYNQITLHAQKTDSDEFIDPLMIEEVWRQNSS